MQSSPTAWIASISQCAQVNTEGALVWYSGNLDLAFSSVRWRFKYLLPSKSLCPSNTHLSGHSQLLDPSQQPLKIYKVITAHIILPSWNVFHLYVYWKLPSPFKFNFHATIFSSKPSSNPHSVNVLFPPCHDALQCYYSLWLCNIAICQYFSQSLHVDYMPLQTGTRFSLVLFPIYYQTHHLYHKNIWFIKQIGKIIQKQNLPSWSSNLIPQNFAM